MKSRIAILTAVSVFAALMLAPVHLHGQQASQAQQHEQHHPDASEQPAQTAGAQQATMMNMMARMKATDQKLDELVKKMNAAKGTEKTNAIAELLTVLVQDQRTMHDSMMSNMSGMMNMMNMMNMMGNMHGRGDTPATPKE